jgi:hypothetical protein
MTETSFPFDAGPGADVTESQWREMAKYWRGSGVLSGVLNSLQVYGDSSGMQVKLKTGEAWIQGFKYKNDAELILAIPAAHASYGRLDRVVLRLDVANNTLTAAVLQGTPSGSPALPALTQNATGTWEVALATITVDATVTTIAAGKVADTRTYSYHTANSSADYDSGWFACAYNNLYTKAHGLAAHPSIVILEWCATNTPGAGDDIALVTAVLSTSNIAVTPLRYNQTNVLAGAGIHVSFGTVIYSVGNAYAGSAAGYYRIRAWR